MKICLAHNITRELLQSWINALDKKGIDYSVIDLSKNDWMDKILSEKFDLVIARPNGALSYQKQLFDERIYIIKHIIGLPVYPNYEALLVYENKRMLSYWLKANNIPHPTTTIIYDYEEARSFIKNSNYPIVIKSNIGGAGSGVHILTNREKALRIINKTFKGKGLPRRGGPNFSKKDVYSRIISKITNVEFVLEKIKNYRSVKDDLDKRNLFFQEFIPHTYEWKNVRIGNSYFSHKKIVHNKKASGTGDKIFIKPPKSLLEFIKEVTNKRNFSSVSVDVFEIGKDKYLVNEVQTYFGQPYSYLMAIDDKPGRYVNKNNKWVFEEGNFNTNHSCDLRLEHALELLEQNKL